MTIQLGLSVNLIDPAVLEIAGWLGYRFAWIDCEHTDFVDVTNHVRAAEAVGLEPWVRVPRNEASLIGRYLNTGVARIIVPHIRSAADAEAAVRYTKFNPEGERNWFSKARDGRYGIIPSVNYPELRSPKVQLVVQVEDPEGIEQIEKILDVPGVDMVMTGPGDLAHALGIAGHFDDPRIQEAEVKVFKAAKARDIPVLHFASSSAELAQLLQNFPVTHVVAASDTAVLVSALRNLYQEISLTKEVG